MPDIVVRPAEASDLDGLDVVRSLTYNNGDPIPLERRERVVKGVQSFVADQGGQIVGACEVLDMTANRGEAVLRCGAVAGVAVLPEARKSGVGSLMMSWLVGHLRETGVPLASLYAFREPFYRKFGYEVAGKRLKITCPTNRWPRLESQLPFHRLTPADWRDLVDCYNLFAATRSGVNMRTERQWKRVLGENRQLTIYAVGEPVEAYAVVSHVTAFWTTDHLSEIVWSTRRGYEGLMCMLGGLAINKTALSWFEPSDGPFYSDYMDQGVSVAVERPIMFRVTDVPAALQALKPPKDLMGSFSFAVSDYLVEENRGPFNVNFSDGSVQVDFEPTASPDFSLDIRNFAQALLGEPNLGDLMRQGRVDVFDEQGFAEASQLLPSSSVCCLDFF